MNAKHIEASLENLSKTVDHWKTELDVAKKQTGWFFEQEVISLENRIKNAEAQIDAWKKHLVPPPDRPAEPRT